MNTQRIFVFGSNLAGRHGAGSALAAKQYYGAVYGVGVGRMGNSYAIPTKDEKLAVLPIDTIANYVNEFIAYAYENPDLQFDVVDIGCGLAGYSPETIAPLFVGYPPNVKLSPRFEKIVKTEELYLLTNTCF